MKKRYPTTSKKAFMALNTECKKSTSLQLKAFQNVALQWQRTRTQRLAKGLQLLAPLLEKSLSIPLSLAGHPLDSALCSLSPLYRHSRSLFLEQGGSFLPSYISSPRTLSSVALLGQEIEYSPLEREYLWAAQDAYQLRDRPKYLEELRLCISNVFHEQNHRILWRFLPKPPQNVDARRRYLNMVESWVVGLDMALGDTLGSPLAQLFHECGVIYDPGTTILDGIRSSREYRNYLQVAIYATYLYLEHFEGAEITQIIRHLHGPLGPIAQRGTERALRLDREFVYRTNPLWQEKYSETVWKTFKKQPGEALHLSDDPLDHCTFYLWTEKWLEKMGL